MESQAVVELVEAVELKARLGVIRPKSRVQICPRGNSEDLKWFCFPQRLRGFATAILRCHRSQSQMSAADGVLPSARGHFLSAINACPSSHYFHCTTVQGLRFLSSTVLRISLPTSPIRDLGKLKHGCSRSSRYVLGSEWTHVLTCRS